MDFFIMKQPIGRCSDAPSCALIDGSRGAENQVSLYQLRHEWRARDGAGEAI